MGVDRIANVVGQIGLGLVGKRIEHEQIIYGVRIQSFNRRLVVTQHDRCELRIERLDQLDRVLNQTQNKFRIGIECDYVAFLFGERGRELENVIRPIELRVADEFDAVDKVSNDQQKRYEQDRT